MSSFRWPPQGAGTSGLVTSLNGETGDIVLTEGAGITITPSGNTIEIASDFVFPSLTAGSVIFSNGTTLAQDNAKFFYDASGHKLGIGTVTPISALSVKAPTDDYDRFLTIQGTGSTNYMTLYMSPAGSFSFINNYQTLNYLTFDPGGGIRVGGSSATFPAQLAVQSFVSFDVPTIIAKKQTSQTADLFEATDTDGSIFAKIDVAGNISATNLSGTNTGNVSLAAVGSSPSANAASLSGQVLTLQPFDGTHPGVVAASGGGSTNFLRADGTWAAPAGTGITALTGDVTASGSGSVAATLATVNSNVGSFGTASNVSAITVNGKGLVTAAANTAIQIAESQVTNLVSDLAGKQPTGNYITALTGDGTAAGPGSSALTLATVNANVGTFASATFNGKGLATAAANLSGDATTSGAALTLATVNSNVGSFGSSTAIPNFTVNGKGLVTAAGTNAVIAPAGTLTGTTLAANVVTSSLTSVGTIATGVWNGTAVDVAHGGTGAASQTAFAVLCGGTTSTGAFQSIAAVGSSGQVLTSNGAGALPTFQAAAGGGTTIRGYIAGLITSFSSTTVLGVASGVATDSTGATYLSLASAFTKSTAGTFVAGTGNNGVDTGTVGNNQWWHVHVISKAAGASPDVLFSLSATAPTLPATYTLFRRIGSFLTDGSAHIINYTQIDNEFRWLAVREDINSTAPGTSAVTRTLASVPTGVVVTANFAGVLTFGSTTVNGFAVFSALVDTDESAGTSGNAGYIAISNSANNTAFSYLSVPTNTSAQIRSRNGASVGDTNIVIRTRGWTDSRGVNL